MKLCRNCKWVGDISLACNTKCLHEKSVVSTSYVLGEMDHFTCAVMRAAEFKCGHEAQLFEEKECSPVPECQNILTKEETSGMFQKIAFWRKW